MAQPNNSRSYAYVLKKGWAHRVTEDHIILETCPACANSNWKFYMRFSPEDKDGLWDCKVCGEKGNLYQLLDMNGDKVIGIQSMKDAAMSGSTPGDLPNVEACHKALMAEGEDPSAENTALDYLVGRGFTVPVIERYKLGLSNDYGKRWLVIPYFHKDKPVFAKFRTLPPDEKDFRSVSGREVPLFNEDCLAQDMPELLFVEGESDALSLISKGVENVVGVPGANIKKMGWVTKLDRIAPKSMFLLYDNDKVGQNAAKEMAKRIGIDKVRNILLPEFTFTDENGEEKAGKDINEWLRAGNTVEDLEALKAEAKFFHIDGVSSVVDTINEVRNDILQNGSLEPKYKFRLPGLNRVVGGCEDGDLIGIMAQAKIGKTTLAQQLLHELSADYAEAAFMFCLEMPQKRLVRKWMSNVTETPEREMTLETVDMALSIAANHPSDILFGHINSRKAQDVYDTIRQVVRRYGAKFVCFDNLQLLCTNLEHSAQETSVITKGFKALAMELGIVILLIIQPHRVGEGQIISARNAHGSSAIEKDVDVMVCLHRNRVATVNVEEFAALGQLETDENFAPEMLVRADLTRFSSGGVCTLKMLGDISKIVEMTHADRAEKHISKPMNRQLDDLVAA